MSTSKRVMRLEGKEKSMELMKNKQLLMNIGSAIRETRPRPRFESHTQSSWMKRKEPRECSLTKNTKVSKKLKRNIVPGRLNGVCKRRSSGVSKQNKNMQTLKTILKRERDCRMSASFQGELTKTSKQCSENSFLSLQIDFIKDVSHKLKRCSETPVKSAVLQDELTETLCRSEQYAKNLLLSAQDNLAEDVLNDFKRCAEIPAELVIFQNNMTEIVHHFEKCTENLRVSLQDDPANGISQDLQQCTGNLFTFPSLQSNSPMKDVCLNDDPIIEISHKIQTQMSDDEESLKSHCEIDDLHRKLEFVKPEMKLKKILSDEECCNKSQSKQQNMPNTNVIIHKYRWKNKIKKKAVIQNDDIVNVDTTCNVNLQSGKNVKSVKYIDNALAKDTRSVTNGNIISSQKCVLEKSHVFTNQRVWKPAGISKSSTVESTSSLIQPAQKSSCTTKASIARKNQQQSKHLSTKHVELFDSANNSANILISKNQTKAMMKENRDPRVDHLTKIKVEQQRKLQSEGTLPKRRRSMTKVACFSLNNLPKTSDSKISNKCNDINPINRDRTSELKPKSRFWQTRLKKVSKDQNDNQYNTEPIFIYKRRSRPSKVIDALKEIINNTKENDNVEKNINVNVVNIPKSEISNQDIKNCEILLNHDTYSRISSDNKLHFTTNKNLNEVSQFCNLSSSSSWNSISTQTDLNYSSFLKINFDSKRISKSTQTIGTQTSPCCKKHTVEIGCNTMSYDFFCKDAEVSCDLTDSMNLKADVDLIATENKFMSENVLSRTIESSFIKYTKTDIEHECTKRSKESTKYFSDYDANNSSVDNLSLEKSCRASSIQNSSCSSSCEEVTEYLKNDAQQKDMVTSRLKMEIPSDVIAAFQLAAERGRNLRKAISLYNESLMSKRITRENKEITTDFNQTSRIYIDDHTQSNASIVSCRSENRMKSECDTKCHFIMINNDNFDKLSACSLNSSNSDLLYDPRLKNPQIDYPEIVREEKFQSSDYLKIDRVIFPGNEKIMEKSILKKHSNSMLTDMESLVQLLIHRTQEEHALEVLKVEEFTDSVDTRSKLGREACEILALSPIENPSVISREYLFALICCVLYATVFWCLNFSFTCDFVT